MTGGIAYAAGMIRAEADTDDDLDIAALCEYTAATHRPGPDMLCLGCGEPWYAAGVFPNLGGLRCQAFIDVQNLKNAWIAEHVQRIADRWAA